jgi:hypothetical protein
LRRSLGALAIEPREFAASGAAPRPAELGRRARRDPDAAAVAAERCADQVIPSGLEASELAAMPA